MGSIPAVAATTPNLMVLKDQTISICAKFALRLQKFAITITFHHPWSQPLVIYLYGMR